MNKIKIFSIVAIAAFVGLFSTLSISQIQIKSLKFDSDKKIESRVDFLDDIIARVKRDYVDEKTDLELSEAAASGILSSLDPHSSYMNADDFKRNSSSNQR